MVTNEEMRNEICQTCMFYVVKTSKCLYPVLLGLIAIHKKETETCKKWEPKPPPLRKSN